MFLSSFIDMLGVKWFLFLPLFNNVSFFALFSYLTFRNLFVSLGLYWLAWREIITEKEVSTATWSPISWMDIAYKKDSSKAAITQKVNW